MRPLATLLIVLGSIGCNGSSSSPDAAKPVDAGASADLVSLAYPAFMPSMPQLISQGKVIAAPTFVPVYFAGEASQSKIDGYLSSYLSSKYWSGAVSEYGVGAATVGNSIVLTESAATAIKSTDIDDWLTSKLDGTHAEFGAVDKATLGAKVFLLYYPNSSVITLENARSCQEFASYHAGVFLPSGAPAYYAVIPRCGLDSAPMTLQGIAAGVSFVTVASATDPVPSLSLGAQGYSGFDHDHAAFGLLGGTEVASACQFEQILTPPELGFPIQRTWSNAAAAAYHDPCLPVPATMTGPYFASVPIPKDMVAYYGGSKIPGILVASGASAMVDVELISDAATSGPWTIKQLPLGPTHYSYTFDKSSGINGDTLHLTVTNTSPSSATESAYFVSTLNGRTTFWAVAVGSQ